MWGRRYPGPASRLPVGSCSLFMPVIAPKTVALLLSSPRRGRVAGPPCRRQCHGGRPGTPGCSPTSPKWSAVGLVGILASDASPWGALAGGTGAAFGPTNLHRRTHRRGFVHPGQRGLEDHPRPGGPRPPPWPLLPRIGHLGPGLGQRLAYSRVICGANNLCGRASDRMLDGRWRYDAVTVLRPTRPAHLRRRSVPRRRPPGSRSAKLLRWFSEKAVRFGPMAAGPDRVSEPHNTTVGRAVFVTPSSPLATDTRKLLCPALAASCRAVVKPTKQAKLSMLARDFARGQRGLLSCVAGSSTSGNRPDDRDR